MHFMVYMFQWKMFYALIEHINVFSFMLPQCLSRHDKDQKRNNLYVKNKRSQLVLIKSYYYYYFLNK